MDVGHQIHVDAMGVSALSARGQQIGASHSAAHAAGSRAVMGPKCRERVRERRGHVRRRRMAIGASVSDLKSKTETFVENLVEDDVEPDQEDDELADMRSSLSRFEAEAQEVQSKIDTQYRKMFTGRVVRLEERKKPYKVDVKNEEAFAQLGKDEPKVMQRMLSDISKASANKWRLFQSDIVSLKLVRTRLDRQIEELSTAIAAAERKAAVREVAMGTEESDEPSTSDLGSAAEKGPLQGKKSMRVVLVTGLESFNGDLYERAAREASERCPAIAIDVFNDRDIGLQPEKLEAALQSADVFFGSLLVQYDEAEWLKKRIGHIPVRFVFESALEIMTETTVGSFNMSGGSRPGAPPAVRKVLSLFGSKREEDRMVGYLSFLKIGPKLLKFLPGSRARDLRTWLTVYSYWNQGGQENMVSMFMYMVEQFLGPSGVTAKPVVETPTTGCLHPDYQGYFRSPREYINWYTKSGPKETRDAPAVAVMIYRKHVITGQMYVRQLIRLLEQEGLKPIPIFINGVEAHTIVRDQLTSADEQALVKTGKLKNATLRKDAVEVNAVISTIGFPLVGGPAGSMEAGRQQDIAAAILASKNIPYVIGAPLLVQDLGSWMRDGIAGLQSVVLYSLPELDGAIDTVPLGGLVGDNIFLIPERVKRLGSRIRNWIKLRQTLPSERKVAILVYGFPPGVGSTGTAALLNVPKSLKTVLLELKAQGYDLGDFSDDIDEETIITALKRQEDQTAIFRGADGIKKIGVGQAAEYGAQPLAAEINPRQLQQMLTYPREWGPSEWGPIPFLPDNDILSKRLEKQWGDMTRYRGIATSAEGNLLVNGLRFGNVFIGVQPVLGVEGDPMRLLFERDLTPHPQYVAFYKWLQEDFQADAVLHFGMHGTVEWLPGAPLGNTGFSWSDILLGHLPNVYVYACNNPSESIIAKRRGYGTIISHNVPPYGRAGLYKQLAELKNLLAEFRENPRDESSAALKGPIIQNLNNAGLQDDCPFRPPTENGDAAFKLTEENVLEADVEEFEEYAGRLYQYLQVLENRLFSEGLHVLGREPSPEQLTQYLSAYFGSDLPEEAVSAVVDTGSSGVDVVKEKLMLNGTTPELSQKIKEAVDIRNLLSQNTEEIRQLVRALDGQFIPAAPGGDLLRDGAGVLPTGRNIHAMDPYRMPSPAAVERGRAVAEAIIQKHMAENDGSWPQTLAVNLWGLDAIKTKGESVAIVLHLIGARPFQEEMGRIARFELMPLEELGRPRVDVLCNMSGIFRDSFQNIVELLDDVFQRAAAADEPPEKNFIRKHALEMEEQGLENTGARLFSNPAGDYGSMVNERVGSSDWESGEELGGTWESRNAFSYGRGQEKGTARPEVLKALLKTTDRIVQEIDSVEYGLTDIQEYYANTGALKAAAESARDGDKVGCSIVETFSKDVNPRELDDVLRMEYRTKLLNPRWAQAMADQGSGGAYEISSRMTAMVGWGATSGFTEDWVWDQASETYALDADMANKLREANPQAFRNVLRRMLEAAGRGMWNADKNTVEQLQKMYSDIEDQLEGVN